MVNFTFISLRKSFVLVFLFASVGLFAQTVTTDKLDYLPGETAFASGSGWVPNEAIILNVSEEPLIHEDVVTNTTADSSGDFTNVAIYNFDASDYGSSFTLTATGETSGYTATAYFTDGAQDIWAWRNQSGPTFEEWDAGTTIQQANSIYAEGEVIPFRWTITTGNPAPQLQEGVPYTIELDWAYAGGTTSPEKLFFDYLTSYNATEAAGVPFGPGSDLGGGFQGAYITTVPIPNDNGGGSTNPPTVTHPAGNFTLYNIDPSSVTFSSYIDDPENANQEDRKLQITFTPSDGDATAGEFLNVGIAWGGHLATQVDYGFENGAANFPGASPQFVVFLDSDISNNLNPEQENQQSNININPNAIIAQGQLTIVKDADPNNAEDFGFTITGPDGANITPSFTLDDDGDATLSNQITFFGLVEGVYTITENTVSGWTLSSITPVENGAEDTTSGDISSIDIGARTATITVANGEDWTITFLNDEVACVPPTIDTQPTEQSVCEGSGASFNVVASGTSLTFQWKENGVDLTNGGIYSGVDSATLNISDITGLDGNTYEVVITESLDCSTTSETVTLTVNALPIAPEVTTTQPTCEEATGSVSVDTPVVGTTYTLTGTNPVVADQTGTSFTGLAPGTYDLIETNEAGCESMATQVVIEAQPDTPVAPEVTTTQPTCEEATGSVSVENPIGTSTYTLTGTNPVVADQTGTSFTGLAPGTYDLIETNEAGCESMATQVVIEAQPDTPVAPEVTTTQPTCEEATGSVSVENPIGTSTYTLTGTNPVVADQTGTSFTGLAPGTYDLIETNEAGCESMATQVVIEAQPDTPVAPEVTTTQPTCEEATGSVSVENPIGTSTYTLTGTNPVVADQTGTSFTGLAPGTYDLIETNEAGCESMATQVVIEAQPDTPVAPEVTTTQPTCEEATGSVSVENPIGTSTYTLTGTNPVVADQTGTSFTGLAPGTYDLIETNEAGCESMATQVVIEAQPDTPVAPEVTTTQPTCEEATGSVSVENPIGTSTYTLTGTNPVVADQTGTSFTGLAPGTYDLIETNEAGCESMATQVVIEAQPDTPVAPEVTTTQPTCEEATGSVSVENPIGTSTYTLTGTNPVVADQTGTSFTGLAPGTYDLIETNEAGCESMATQVVIEAQPDTPVAPEVTTTQPTCEEATGSVSVENPIGTSTYTLTGTNPVVADQTGTSFTGLAPGTYDLIETNEAGCESMATQVVIEAQPDTPVAPEVTTTQPTCEEATGSVSVENPIGTSTYTLTGTNPVVADQTGTSFTGLAPGTYDLIETNEAGCESMATQVVIEAQPDTPVAPEVTTTQPTCEEATGSVSVENPIGTSTYTLTGTNPVVADQTGTSFTGLAPGTYDLIETNEAGCESMATQVVIEAQPDTPVAPEVTTTQPTCEEATGSVSVENPIGTSTYTLTGTNPVVADQTGTSFTGLAPGTYDLIETNEAGCESMATQVVIEAQPDTPVAPEVTTTQPTCEEATGSVSVENPIGTSTYTLTGTNPVVADQTGTSFTGLAPGTYDLIETNEAGCESMATQVVIEAQPDTPVAPEVTTTQPTCEEAGSASIVPVAGLTYTVSPSGTVEVSGTITGLTVGTEYTVTAENASGCTADSAVFSIGATLDAVDMPVIKGDTNYCYGDNGVILDAGSGYASYSWSNGATTQIITATAGTYTVTVKNEAGCEATSSSFVVNAPVELTCSITGTNVTYNGGADGTATVNPVGGTEGYTYVWSTGATTKTIEGLYPGTYSVVVTDDNNCTTECEVVIEQPELTLTCQINLINHVLCKGDATGSATAIATGGVAPYTYYWDNGETTATATGLNAGVHRVTITDANGSETSCTYCIVEPEQLLCTINLDAKVSSPEASDGSATITPVGGTMPYTYKWDNGETTATATGLTAGSHTAWVIDAEGCMTDCTVYVAVVPQIQCSISLNSSVSCNGDNTGSATVTVVGGIGNYTYAWDNGETTQTATHLKAGIRRVTVTDADGNSTSCSICIVEPKELLCNVSLEHGASSGISNGRATVGVTGGVGPYTYLWENGETTATATSLPAGTLNVVVTDANGCETSCSVCVSEELSELTCSIAQAKQVTCNGGNDGSAKVNPLGGSGVYTYLWDNGEITANAIALTAGVHQVTVTDSSGNTTSCTICIGEPDELSCNIILDNGVTAYGASDGKATVSVSGGIGPFVYNWDNGETGPTAHELNAGNHSVEVTDKQGCTTQCEVWVGQPDEISVSCIEVQGILCFGDENGSAMVSTSGGEKPYTYLWSNGETNQVASNLKAGTYEVTVTDANGIEVKQSITLDEPDSFTCEIDKQNDVSVNGAADGAATALPNGGVGPYEYKWSNGYTSANVDNLEAGTYQVIITDKNGCTTYCEILISEPNAVEICDGIDNDGDGKIDEGFDADNDGVADCYDICDGGDDTVDTDGDQIPDACDECDDDGDDDGDGIKNCDDICEGGDDNMDSDGDGTPDFCDTCDDDADDDGDGVKNCDDICDGGDDNMDSDGDGIPDGCDVEECDGVDNNGDGQIDEGLDCSTDPVDGCETAFAYYSENNACFLDDETLKSNRWGWTNYFAQEGNYTMDLYSGAGQCDLSNGVKSGDVNVSYVNGSVSISIDLLPGFVMNEVQIYVGDEKYPLNNGKPTVAPGQYPFVDEDLNNATAYDFGPIDVSSTGGIYVIVHAVTCATSNDSAKFNGNTKVTAFPTIFNNELTVQVESAYASPVNVEMYDMNGRLVVHKKGGQVGIGTNQIMLNVGNLAPDMYIVILKTNREKFIRKVISKK